MHIFPKFAKLGLYNGAVGKDLYMKKQKFQPKFLVGEDGKVFAVQLDVAAYEALMEELEDMHDIERAEKIMAKKPKMHTLEEVKKSLLIKGK
jgi:PHD/YefM family antitoxin component YafN of YafNO toxin-antitoxin module